MVCWQCSMSSNGNMHNFNLFVVLSMLLNINGLFSFSLLWRAIFVTWWHDWQLHPCMGSLLIWVVTDWTMPTAVVHWSARTKKKIISNLPFWRRIYVQIWRQTQFACCHSAFRQQHQYIQYVCIAFCYGRTSFHIHDSQIHIIFTWNVIISTFQSAIWPFFVPFISVRRMENNFPIPFLTPCRFYHSTFNI